MTAATRVAARSRPILFSGAMVRAILDGSKTQTRRLVKPPRVATLHGRHSLPDRHFADSTADLPDGAPNRYLHWFYGGGDLGTDHCATRVFCPFGKPGDRLWVRETWQAIHVSVDPETGYGDDVFHAAGIPDSDEDGYWGAVYAATDPEANAQRDDRGFPWRPSIHMPRWASRLTLEVTDVRVERLQEITPHDALAEGVDYLYRDDAPPDQRAVDAFAALWDSLAKPPATWAENPWVWVVGFRRVAP